jgi:hypothetical protein
MWLPLKNLYLTAGFDFIFWPVNQNAGHPEFASGYRPFLGLGLRF